MRRKLFDDASLEKMLYERAGLLGLSGISGDMRLLQDSVDPRAVAAVEYFVYAMTKYVGAYAAVLGGLDAFVFTAGIGEHSVPVRAALCSKMAWLGVKLDEPANVAGGPRISAPDSGVSVWVIPTNEELMIAQHTLGLVRPLEKPLWGRPRWGQQTKTGLTTRKRGRRAGDRPLARRLRNERSRSLIERMFCRPA